MAITAGIDVGTGAVKVVIMQIAGGGRSAAADGAVAAGLREEVLAKRLGRIRRREIWRVVDEVLDQALADSGVDRIDYIATTGDGEDIPFGTGHFYGMTTHARGGLFLEPDARAIIDIGALHTRAVSMDSRGKVLDYKMTSQCASGSGQFLENISRYLGVSLSEVGELSLQSTAPETVSSICAVLAETDVINMVSRGIATTDILRGIHQSMAGRYARLLRSMQVEGLVLMTGGLAADVGLKAALDDAMQSDKLLGGGRVKLTAHPLSVYAGALGAAIWGAFRYEKLDLRRPAWSRTDPIPSHAS